MSKLNEENSGAIPQPVKDITALAINKYTEITSTKAGSITQILVMNAALINVPEIAATFGKTATAAGVLIAGGLMLDALGKCHKAFTEEDPPAP